MKSGMIKSRIKNTQKTLTEEKIENLIYNCTLGVENSLRMFEYAITYKNTINQ